MLTGILLSGSALAIIGIGAATPYFLKWLAIEDILFTPVPEGTAKAIMRSESLDHFVMSDSHLHLNDPNRRWYDSKLPVWEVLGNVHGESYKDPNVLAHWLGLAWVGLPDLRTVKRYMFSWSELVQNTDGSPNAPKYIVLPRKAETDFIYVTTFPYIMTLEGAETKENIQVNVTMQVKIRITNPSKALFGTENWLEVTTGDVLSRARSHVGKKTFAELRSEISEDGIDASDGFSCPITKLSDELPDDKPGVHEFKGLRGRYGVLIEGVSVFKVDLVGPDADKIALSSVRAYTVEQDAKATEREGMAAAAVTLATGKASADVEILKGTAAASAILATGKAEADIEILKGKAAGSVLASRLKALAKHQDLGKIMLQTDAMSVQGPTRTVLWAANPFISSTPGLVDALNGAGVTSIDQLKDFILKFVKEEEAA
jgi:regulator of protease activity HflC (stomatin/prohibitin superfamily)